MTTATAGFTRADYERVFHLEQVREYPVIDAFEQRCGYKLDRAKLEHAALVLACPIKQTKDGRLRNIALWQHGRVLYAAYRQALEGCKAHILALDIGTAKGFSALVARWALDDAGVQGDVVSVDVVDPCERKFRKTIRDIDGPTTVFELLSEWPDAARIRFQQSTGARFLHTYEGRIRVAFVDGKHDYRTVREEAALLKARQHPGDLLVFDDCQMPGVKDAVDDVTGYEVEYLDPTPDRVYAVARRV